MDWTAIGAIGQILGTLAVFITLGYLAVQLRYQREDSLRSVRQSRADMAAHSMVTLATDPRLADIEARANSAMGGPGPGDAFVTELVARSDLSESEGRSLYWLYVAQWQVRSQIIQYMPQMTPSERILYGSIFKRYYGEMPASRLWWENWRTGQPNAIRDYIDELLQRPG